ncbi:hypothetical protein [Alloactinosynnema sp. L-07]|uniref:YbaB/EbfC family nucleoid-associated protein n=1 Tax=Alloactinosynnema sp. L-07 TaxID=1653480 RepID=UPI00065F079C|nr:YbaB/EbfC family nucleoid-associated protein [Alloactinosynnema sp. L-07]CRK58170.1 hypothetical protein [Alloactinosynnema sp. L-07]
MFSDDVSRILRLGDPDQVADGLERWQRELADHAAKFDRMQQAAAALRVTETAADGGLKVTCDAVGQVVEIITNDRLETLRTDQIGPAVLACIRRAQQTLADRLAETAAETMGDDPMSRGLAEQFRAQFARPDDAEGETGGTEAPQPRSRGTRPDPPDDPGDGPIRWEHL